MADIKSPEERSANMARIRNKDTKPEAYIRKILYGLGYRYRKNSNKITGHPDIWIHEYNVAVFVNGCYWHRHSGCKYAYMPKSRVEFWKGKFERNIKRDIEVHEKLKSQGIRVLIVWECAVKRMMKSDDYKTQTIEEIQDFLLSESQRLSIPSSVDN